MPILWVAIESVIDSQLSVAQTFANQSFPNRIVKQQTVLTVDYLGYDGKDHRGQIVVHKSLAEEVKRIFAELKKVRFPIEKVIPMVTYGWDDELAMADNNTSGFNYRTIPGSKTVSDHAYGWAIDINTKTNPFFKRGAKGFGPYDPKAKGAISHESSAYKVFRRHGWKWGGDWKYPKDYQHFYKRTKGSQ